VIPSYCNSTCCWRTSAVISAVGLHQLDPQGEALLVGKGLPFELKQPLWGRAR
jgi:hypothetical protein